MLNGWVDPLSAPQSPIEPIVHAGLDRDSVWTIGWFPDRLPDNATQVIIGHPGAPSRVRTHKGQFWDSPALRAGPRLEVELPSGSGETYLVSFAPVNEANDYVGLGGTLVLHPQPADQAYWRTLLPGVVAAINTGPRFWDEPTKLISEIVRSSAAVMLSREDQHRSVSACLFYDVVNETSVRWALAQTLGELP